MIHLLFVQEWRGVADYILSSTTSREMERCPLHGKITSVASQNLENYNELLSFTFWKYLMKPHQVLQYSLKKRVIYPALNFLPSFFQDCPYQRYHSNIRRCALSVAHI